MTVTAPAAVVDTIVGMIRGFDAHPRQVFLDARAVEIERADLTRLGIEWGSPMAGVDEAGKDAGSSGGIQVGSLPDRASTNSFWAGLRTLGTMRRARIMANPQMVTQIGRPIQLLSFGEVWANYPSAQAAREAERGREEAKKVFAGTSLLMTPRSVGHSEIIFNMAIEIGNQGGSADVGNPVRLTRRHTQSTITIQDGGTVVIAGLATNPAGQRGQSAREIAIVVTARLIPEMSPVVPRTPETRRNR